ncbi:MAG TPA: hypothetical protein VFB72_07105 [Verrucomicrobiae bacterium]|nr:hypothetical protein [Verrucomicrobiae bacterium]
MMTNSLAQMPIPKLKRALELREQIDILMMELNALMGGNGFIPINGNGGRKHAPHAQNLHWSARNGHGTNGHGTNGHFKKTRLSAQGRAKVSAAVKARWARYRAAKARAGRAK